MLEPSSISYEPALRYDELELVRFFNLLNAEPTFGNRHGTLDIAFVNEEECQRLHQMFFNDPSSTDVMTFPGDPEEDHWGDIAVCPLVAKLACEENKLSFSQELSLYLIHGWLHLAGLDDQTDEDRTEMRKGEQTLIKWIQDHQGTPDFDWNPI